MSSKYQQSDLSRFESIIAKASAKASAARSEANDASQRIARLKVLEEDTSSLEKQQAKYSALADGLEKEAAASSAELARAKVALALDAARADLVAWQGPADEIDAATVEVLAALDHFAARIVSARASLPPDPGHKHLGLAMNYANEGVSLVRQLFGTEGPGGYDPRIVQIKTEFSGIGKVADHLADSARNQLSYLESQASDA
jgi:hypothetical protein